MLEILNLIKIENISSNPYQPRLEFKQKELEELAQSIKENGLIQPIIVRPSSVFGYELIAGERRLKASKLAGLTDIPAIVKEISDRESMQLAIIENLQRSDLNPIEEANAYQQLLSKNQMTHEELAQFMGKSRPYITNCLRLLKLPYTISKAVETGKISQGHARLLLTVKDSKKQDEWYQKIINQDISVRKLEDSLKTRKGSIKSSKKQDLFLKNKEQEIAKALGFPVKLYWSKNGKGELRFSLDSEEDLNKIINKLI